MHCEVRDLSKSFVLVCMLMWLGFPRSFVVRWSEADVIVGVKYWWVGVLGLKRSQSMYLPLEWNDDRIDGGLVVLMLRRAVCLGFFVFFPGEDFLIGARDIINWMRRSKPCGYHRCLDRHPSVSRSCILEWRAWESTFGWVSYLRDFVF